MLTKATFHLLARTIRETREEFSAGNSAEALTLGESSAAVLALESLARNLADRLGELNPAFDRTRFLAACRNA